MKVNYKKLITLIGGKCWSVRDLVSKANIQPKDSWKDSQSLRCSSRWNINNWLKTNTQKWVAAQRGWYMGNTNKIKLIQVEEMKNIKLNYDDSDQASVIK